MDRCSDLIEQIDAQLKNLLTARAMFPHMREHLVGKKECTTAPFYWNRGFKITFSFAEPLTALKIADSNQIGHWINQNYIVRLYALLASFSVISDTRSINTQLDGHDDVDILRRLRNVFAHGSGWYDQTSPKHKKLRERIIEHYALEPDNHPESDDKFPIPIDRVVVPMTEACKRYSVMKTSLDTAP
jgi:hypothetical protein